MKKKYLFLLLPIFTLQFIQAQFSRPINIARSGIGIQVPVDFDNDGDLDILASGNSSQIFLYKNDSTKGFQNKEIKLIDLKDKFTFYTSSDIKCIFTSDVNQDGYEDVLIGFSSKYVCYLNNGGNELIYSWQGSGSINSFATADINSDGLKDIIISRYSISTSDISWLKNLGNGTFDTAQVLANNLTGTVYIYAADIDYDGIIDIYSGSGSNNSDYAWYKNDGSGNFSQKKIIGSGGQVKSIWFEDIDGDNIKDIISSSSGVNNVFWFKNNGFGQFSTKIIIDHSTNPNQSIPTDYDNDGDMDIITLGSSINFYENDGNGNFPPPVELTLSASFRLSGLDDDVFIADFNNDGLKDILSDNRILYKNNINNLDVYEKIIASAKSTAHSTVMVDFDNDGDSDILACYTGMSLGWYENFGDLNFSAVIPINISPGVLFQYQNTAIEYPTTAAYIDNDSLIDIVALVETAIGIGTEPDFTWVKNISGNDFSSPSQNIGIGMTFRQIEFIDLDGNFKDDIVFANYNGIFTSKSLGNGNFSTPTQISSYTNPFFNISDINGNGYNDIVISASNKIAWYQNNGTGSFSNVQILENNLSSIRALATGDLDNDGLIDIVYTDYNLKELGWYQNLGNGNFGTKTIIDSLKYFDALCIDDIDLDQNIDLIVGTIDLNWYKNIGAGSFSSPSLIDQDVYVYGRHSISTRDLDKDGDPEIIYSRAKTLNKTGKISVYRNLTNHNYILKGKTFYDNNQNGVFDSSESYLPSVPVNISPNSIQKISTINGNYDFYVGIGSYNINYQIESIWNLTSDSSSYHKIVSDSLPIYENLDFGFYPDTIITTIKPELTSSFPRCNDTINYWLSIRNNGTTIPSGLIHLKLDNAINYLTADFPTDSIVGNNIYWSYDSLFFNSNKKIKIQVRMPPFTSIGDTLISFLSVNSVDSLNLIVFENKDTLKQILVCAYDPNDKKVSPKGLGTEGYISNNQELEYLIRFQNTGNDTAMNVTISDSLDINLNWNSLVPVASSHPMNITVDQNGIVFFNFNNIMLPDSNVNEIGSHGFIKFKINMKTNLPPGTIIKNKSYIYFDQNPAILTNTTVNTIYDCYSTPLQLNTNQICLLDEVTSFSEVESFSTYQWEIDSFYTATSDSFNWLADTIGLFNLKMTITNDICIKDTSLNLSILPTQHRVDSLSICQGDSILLYSNFQNSAGTYYDSLQNIYGCDSILVTNLVVNPIFESNQSMSICQGDSILIYSNFQNSAGTYYDSLQNIHGCDSILSTNLNINTLPNVNISNLYSDSLCLNIDYVTLPSAVPIGGVYSGNGIIGNTFEPLTANVGNHNIVYTFIDGNSCLNADTITISVFACTDINNETNDYGFIIYPNPSNGNFTVEKTKKSKKEVQINILDVTLKKILTKVLNEDQQKITIDIRNYSKGVYYIQLTIDNKQFVKQLIKK